MNNNDDFYKTQLISGGMFIGMSLEAMYVTQSITPTFVMMLLVGTIQLISGWFGIG